MVLEQISSNVWALTRPFRIPLGGDIGGRMTVLRLKNKDLVLISPVEFDDEVVNQINSLGKVKYIIAPNSTHHLFIKKALLKFPGSLLAAPPGLVQKRKDLNVALILDSNSWPYKSEVEIFVLKAKKPVNEEVLFFHKEDRILVVTDFVFNLQNIKGLIPTVMARLNNSYRRLGMTKIGRLSFMFDEDIRNALQQIAYWQPEILILAHGEIIHGHVHQKIKSSFYWLGD